MADRQKDIQYSDMSTVQYEAEITMYLYEYIVEWNRLVADWEVITTVAVSYRPS
jgi:hypothetical protein